MALRLGLGAAVAPALRRTLARGQRAMFRAVFMAWVIVAGAGLLLASALLALSAWIGPIAATGIGGLTLLLAAFVAVLARRGRRLPRSGLSDTHAADLPANGTLLLRGVMVAVGFALLGQVLRKRP